MPVANLGKLPIDWDEVGPRLARRILDQIGLRFIPDIHDRVMTSWHTSPRDHAQSLNAWLGSAFSLEPLASQSAWLRPRQRDAVIGNFYLVGAGTHPRRGCLLGGERGAGGGKAHAGGSGEVKRPTYEIKRLAVYCGSAAPSDPRYIELARQVGDSLAQRGIGVVYGGGRLGLMGAVASAALAAGGEVIGVIPQALAAAELANHACTELRVVRGMHERKQAFTDLSDGFLTLPAGSAPWTSCGRQ